MSSPSLVGGISLRAYDLPASIVFAAAYGLLLPVFVYRIVDRRSRTAVIIQALCFAIERPVVYSLRAVVAAQPSTESPGLSEYMQATFALGYLTLVHMVSKLIRSVLVNTTNGTPASESKPQSVHLPPLVSTDSTGFWKPSAPLPSTPGIEDPRRRFWYRRWSEFLGVLYLAAMVTAIVATAHIYKATDTAANLRDQALRYTSSAIGLTVVILETSTLLWARKNVPRIDQRAMNFLLVMTMLLTIPPLYRLVVMHSTTPNIATPGHQALNTAGDKAAFYVLHLLPEFLVTTMMCAFNVKDICQTGCQGDYRWRDETPKEREKREKKEREKEMKKAEAKNASLELTSRNSNTSGATLA
ncbi:hypothetical protein B0H19DRAFT_1371620 [Mycena capillaripes]|nr:hypothetical protein B0H19DRAFT_1371620 [Mycena capillaripes]